MTPAQVAEFCQETRQLAAQLRNYAAKHESLIGPRAKAPCFTGRERQRVDRALMALEDALGIYVEIPCGRERSAYPTEKFLQPAFPDRDAPNFRHQPAVGWPATGRGPFRAEYSQ